MAATPKHSYDGKISSVIASMKAVFFIIMCEIPNAIFKSRTARVRHMQIDDLIALKRKDDRKATHPSPHTFNEVIVKSKSNQDHCIILSRIFRKKYLKAHSFLYILTIILSVYSKFCQILPIKEIIIFPLQY